MAETRVRVGVSSCLLGERVRWDGGHKRARFLVEVLGPRVEWVPVCPEVELGLGVPREPIRLEGRSDGVHLLGVTSGTDHTAAMREFARRRVAALAVDDLSGYVLKAGSPSCGLERVPTHGEPGLASAEGRGLFAEALLERFPDLPVEDEARLEDPAIRSRWLERVFAYRPQRTS